MQLLFVDSDVQSAFYSSPNDLGGDALIAQAYGGPATFTDTYFYHGKLFASPQASQIGIGVSPLSPTHTPFDGIIDPNTRDADDHGASILKLQYQKNFSSSSYLRIFGYSEYNDWFLNGPVSAYTTYGGELQDYEVHGNDYGITTQYSNQINDKNLLTATASYLTQKLETYSGNTYQGTITTNLADAKGNCYSPSSGLYASCYNSVYDGTGGGLVPYGFFGTAPAGYPACPLSLTAVGTNCAPLTPPAGSPAVANGAKYLVTNDGQSAQIDEITPFYSAVSLTDQWHPTERVTANIGLRVENFNYRLDDTVSGYPARAFWFGAYNREFSFGTSATSVGQCTGTDANGNTIYGVNPTTGASLCAPGTNADLVNASPRTVSFTAYQPRLSFTYSLDPDTVLRGSYGRYAAPAPTSYQQYNVLQQDSPSFIGQFLPYGFNEPYHESRPSYSNNYDFSLEKHLKGTDISFKLTPFYRSTQDQLANVPIGSQGILDGLNVGRQRNYGVEFQIRKGEFDRNGFSTLLSYTRTRSRVTYDNFGTSSRNEIDNLNDYIRNYNAYTKACSTASNTALCGSTSVAGVTASPCYLAGAPDPACGTGSIANPYYNAAPQPLMDRNGEYTPYDILPSPFQGANGYETPDVATLVLNYKHNKFAITPSFTFSSGSFYGSPLVWPGYDPLSCGAATTGTQANPQTCSGYLFIPDKFTGKFDSFGDFKEPSRLSANLQFAYESSRNVKLTLTMTGLTDTCFQRNEPWDSPSTCVYAQLPSNNLAPVGNFVTDPAKIPIQLAYPYGSWYNNSQTGFVGQKLPFSAFLSLDVRL
ncbi:MAG: TonB-dependent receptor [Candidatus Eremiobacteraeota bacterium]|nr:TonB-dependent receptor [Candidatus Eremiobacteraeota bacterium]